jgi:hypothetical protein
MYLTHMISAVSHACCWRPVLTGFVTDPYVMYIVVVVKTYGSLCGSWEYSVSVCATEALLYMQKLLPKSQTQSGQLLVAQSF